MHLSQSSEIAEIIASYASTFFDIKSVQESHLQTRYGNFLLPPIVDPYLFLLRRMASPIVDIFPTFSL
jgi:hypothetical protein